MSHKELIEKVRNTLIKLADLQKEDLEDTSDMINYHLASTQLIRIRALIHKDNDPNKIVPMIQTLQKTSLAELKSELPKMIAEHHMQEALQLYEEIKKDLRAIEAVLEQSGRDYLHVAHYRK